MENQTKSQIHEGVFMRLTCMDCNAFQVENPEPIAYIRNKQPVYNGRCYAHGYFIRSNEEICCDFDR